MARAIANNLVIAPVTVNSAAAYTAGPVMQLGKTAKLKTNDKSSKKEKYYDGVLDEIVKGVIEKTLEFDVKEIIREVEALLTGKVLNKGMLIESTTDAPATDFAIGYRVKESSTNKYTFVWKYVCSVECDFSEEFTSNSKDVDTKDATLKFIIKDRAKDGKAGVTISEKELIALETEAKTAIATWFTKPVEPIV